VEKEYSQIYKTVGLGTTIWSPLASGVLTGKYSKGGKQSTRLTNPKNEWLKDAVLTEKSIKKAEKLGKLAADLSISMPELAIAWCLKNDDVSTVILGASKLKQLKENMKAAEAVGLLTDKVMEKIEGILNNKPAHPQF